MVSFQVYRIRTVSVKLVFTGFVSVPQHSQNHTNLIHNVETATTDATLKSFTKSSGAETLSGFSDTVKNTSVVNAP